VREEKDKKKDLHHEFLLKRFVKNKMPAKRNKKEMRPKSFKEEKEKQTKKLDDHSSFSFPTYK
jgi:hypothetical protein